LRDPGFLERLARQCLGMVKPGEVAFVVVPVQGAPAPPPEC
jgi:cell division protein FtsB